jgi:hypothetical protein
LNGPNPENIDGPSATAHKLDDIEINIPNIENHSNSIKENPRGDVIMEKTNTSIVNKDLEAQRMR